MKKIIFVYSMLFVCSQMSLSQTREDLKNIIIELNSEMPMTIGPSGEIQSMTLENDELIWEMTASYINSQGSRGKISQEEYKEEYLLSLSGGLLIDSGAYDFYALLVKLQIGIRMHIMSENTRDENMIRITPDELSKCINTEPDYLKILEITVKNANLAYPINMYGMTFIRSELKEDLFVTTIVVDNTQNDIEIMEAIAASSKERIAEMIKNQTDLSLTFIAFYCYMADYGFAYEYKDPIKNKSVIIKFDNSELEKIFFAGKE